MRTKRSAKANQKWTDGDDQVIIDSFKTLPNPKKLARKLKTELKRSLSGIYGRILFLIREGKIESDRPKIVRRKKSEMSVSENNQVVEIHGRRVVISDKSITVYF